MLEINQARKMSRLNLIQLVKLLKYLVAILFVLLLLYQFLGAGFWGNFSLDGEPAGFWVAYKYMFAKDWYLYLILLLLVVILQITQIKLIRK